MWVQLEILLTGVAIVLGVLTLLWVTSALVSLGFRLAKRFEKPAAAPADSGQPGQNDQAGLPEHHLALIAAAVASVLDSPGDWKKELLQTLDPTARAAKVLERLVHLREVLAAQKTKKQMFMQKMTVMMEMRMMTRMICGFF